MAKERDDDKGFGPRSGDGRFSGRYTREQDEKTGGRQLPKRTGAGHGKSRAARGERPAGRDAGD